MSNPAIQKFDYLTVLLRAPEAIKNRFAFLLWGATLLIAVAIYGFGSFLALKMFGYSSATPIAMGIAAILGVLVLWVGTSGVGLMLMDQANDIEPRGMMDAVIGGLMCTGKFLLVMLLDVLMATVFLGASALLLFICKIPGVGAALYAVVYPVIVLVAGLLIAMFLFIILPMTFPAIWEGNSVTGIYARRWALFRNRLMQIFTSQIGLFFIVGLVGVIIMTVLWSGFLVATGLSAPIIGSSMDMERALGGLGMLMMGGSGGGEYIMAGMLGFGILLFIAYLIPGLIATFGMNLIYLRAVEGLDFSVAEAGIAAKMAEARQRAEEAKVRATEAAQRAREAAAQRQQAQNSAAVQSKIVQPQPAAAALACPGCGVSVTADDAFCGECGHKLK
jgi:hypothetical protein